MLEQFKKVFIICSLDQYQTLADHESEILSGLEKYRIVYPYMYGEDIEEVKETIGKNVEMPISDDFFLEMKFNYAKKQLRTASKCVYINEIIDQDVNAEVEAMTELIEARKRKIDIIAIDSKDLVKADSKVLKR